ncbi:MAG: RNA polymerase sigma factor [Thermoguttaceae bacterium]
MSANDSSFKRETIASSYSTSSTLIGRLKEQDHAAWERLRHLFGLLVLTWCRQVPLLQRVDRQDIFQDVFLTAFQKIDQFQKEKGSHQSFRGWLKSITRSRIADQLRKMRKSPQLLSDTRMELLGKSLQVEPVALAEDEQSLESERLEIYRRAISIIRVDFEPQTWEAFARMTTGRGITSREVGEELGMSPEAVRKAKSKVLRRLREEFGNLLD